MKVYIVTAGDYSAYHIERVFLDKEKANIYAKMNGGEVERYNTHDDKFEIPEKLHLLAEYYFSLDAEKYPNMLRDLYSSIESRLVTGKPTHRTVVSVDYCARGSMGFFVRKSFSKNTSPKKAREQVEKIGHDVSAKIKHLYSEDPDNALNTYDFSTEQGLKRMVDEQFNNKQEANL